MATADLLMSNSLARAEREGQKVTARRTDWQWWSHDSRFVTHNPYQASQGVSAAWAVWPGIWAGLFCP